ncbi:response regulator [Nodularia spumigena]|uniref:response regulator n=1 Tax=Nodularia spumigena TaxID=70799 RepID=UPI0030D8C134
MSNILLIDEHPETKNLLMKCLETAGFEVIFTENGLVSVQLAHEKFSTTTESKKIKYSEVHISIYSPTV